jgi:hypothetical protein
MPIFANTTFDYTIPFIPTIEFYPDAVDLAQIIFAIIVVAFTTAIGMKYQVGEGTVRYRKRFMAACMVILVLVQYYQLW